MSLSVDSLGARNAGSCWALRTLSDLESDHIAHFEFIEHDANEVLGVEEQILCLAIASNESESSVRKGLDCSGHS